MGRRTRVNRTVFMAFWGLFIATPIWAELQDEQFQDDQIQADQPQITRPKQRPKHKQKPVVDRVDPAVQLRHQMREKINRGLVGIVSEGSDRNPECRGCYAHPRHRFWHRADRRAR